jgi:hypothetical protein
MKNLFSILVLFCACVAIAASHTPINNGLMQSDLDGGGHSITNLNNAAATNFYGGGAGISNLTASSVSGALTNQVPATNIFSGGLLSQSVEDLTQATNEVTRQTTLSTNYTGIATNTSAGYARTLSAADTNEVTRQINSSTNIYASLGTAISDLSIGTNLIYRYTTNIVGAANFVFGKAYWTNATANFTFPALTMQDNAAMETMVIMVTNSGAATITATINGVSGGPAHTFPALFYCTNAAVTEIDVKHFGVLWTNAMSQ